MMLIVDVARCIWSLVILVFIFNDYENMFSCGVGAFQSFYSLFMRQQKLRSRARLDRGTSLSPAKCKHPFHVNILLVHVEVGHYQSSSCICFSQLCYQSCGNIYLASHQNKRKTRNSKAI